MNETYWIENQGSIDLQNLTSPCFSDVPYKIELLFASAKLLFLALDGNMLTRLLLKVKLGLFSSFVVRIEFVYS